MPSHLARSLAGSLLALSLAALAGPVCQPCGPTCCTGTQEHTQALAAKKVELAKQSPAPPRRLK